MQKGTLDGAFTVPSDVRGVFGPLGDLFNQYPGGPASDEMVTWIYYGNGKTMLQELIESKGFSNVQVIGVANLSLAEDELWVKKKIEKPEDYKGLKVRTYGQWGKVLEAVGASVVTLPGGEVYQAMERGSSTPASWGPLPTTSRCTSTRLPRSRTIPVPLAGKRPLRLLQQEVLGQASAGIPSNSSSGRSLPRPSRTTWPVLWRMRPRVSACAPRAPRSFPCP